MKNIIVAFVIVILIWVVAKVSFHDGVYDLNRGEYVENSDAMALYQRIVRNGGFNFDHINFEEMDETQFEAFLLSFQKCSFTDDMSYTFTGECEPALQITYAKYIIDDAKLAAMGRRLLYHPSEQVRVITFTIFAESDFYLDRPRDIFNAAEAMNDERIDYYLMFLLENPELLMGDKDVSEFKWAQYDGLDAFYERCENSKNPAVKLQALQRNKTPEEIVESIEETDKSYQNAFSDRGCYTKKDILVRGMLLSRCPVSDEFLFEEDCRAMKFIKLGDYKLCGIDNINKMEEELFKMTESKDPQTRYYGLVYSSGDQLMKAIDDEEDPIALGLYIQYYLDQEKIDNLEEDELKALERLTTHRDERISKLATSVWNRLHLKEGAEQEAQ